MSIQLLLVILILIYLLIGTLTGLFFVLKGVRALDPIANTAPLRVRVLFFPGAVAIWPIVIHRSKVLSKKGSQD